MLLNFIKIALRNILRNKLHSFINIIGLSIGIACAIMLLLFVRYELSYDRHNLKYERIYMVQSKYVFEAREFSSRASSFAVGPALKDEYPAVEEYVRILWAGRMYFKDEKEEVIGQNGVCYADPSIFKVFDHKFIYGSPEVALDSPNSIVLNKTSSQKYFGDENPVDKTLSGNNGIIYKVTGVFEDLPLNSINYYTVLLPLQDFVALNNNEDFKSRQPSAFFNLRGENFTFILITKNTDIKDIENDNKHFKDKYYSVYGKEDNKDLTLFYEPLKYAYLNYSPVEGFPPVYLFVIYLLSSMAIFILIIACINYMNLATAKAMSRAREIAVRKVLGADRKSLARQFLVESIVLTTIAMLIALVLVELCLPPFNDIVNKRLSLGVLTKPDMFLGLIIVTLITGFLAGSFPAIYLSNISPVNVFKGGMQTGKSKGSFRKLLVVTQFAVSIMLIIFAFLIQEQSDYIHSRDLGFKKDNILVINSSDPEINKMIPVFKNEVLKNSSILAVAKSNILFGKAGRDNMEIEIEDSKGSFIGKHVAYTYVDFDTVNLMEMKILEGRSFNREMETDQGAILVNETLVKDMGWTDSPLGKNIRLENRERKIVGVLKDFNYEPLTSKIRPMIILLGGIDHLPLTYIKVHSKNLKETIGFIKRKWEKLNPRLHFEYDFLDDIISHRYRLITTVLKVINFSAVLGIFISCTGLYGLSSFMVEKRKKEIGIRKVNGASLWNILCMLSFDYLKLILIACVIGWPAPYLFMEHFSYTFYYMAEMNWWFITIAAFIVLLIALMTVSYHAVKVALTDPVKTLRYE